MDPPWSASPVQTRTKVLNDELEGVFRRWYPQFRPKAGDPRLVVALPSHALDGGPLPHLARQTPEGEKPRKAATITRRLTSINAAHKEKGLDSPATMNHRLVADTLHGIRRTLGVAQTRKKPLTRDRIVKLLGALDGPIAAARDKALLLIGFAGSLRRSELAALRVEEITWHRKGITLLIPRSKTDQEGEGREVEILLGVHDQTCPVMALENWLKISGVKAGQVFRRVGQHGNVGEALDKDSIGRIVKRLVRRAKLANPESYGGHSLRAGFVTEASPRTAPRIGKS